MFAHLTGKRVQFITLGCKVNSYETDALRLLFAKSGCIETEQENTNGESADICIVNTCSVTNIADRKSRQMLHRMRRENPSAVIAATGCYAQIGGLRLIEGGDADIVAGNDRKTELPELLDRYLAAREQGSIPDAAQRCIVGDIAATRSCEAMRIADCSERSRAFVKVEDGCDQFCSYCIIPYARGRVRSREADDVVAEVIELARAGYREVVLTGIHLSSYGNAHYEQKGDIRFDYRPLLELIGRVAAVEGIDRVRLGSLEPRIICTEFAEALAIIPEFCPQFHLSLQSGCAATLKRMNRHYSPEEYLEICDILRRSFDRPALTTDVIVGFPGETDEEFEESVELLKKAAFSKMHVFKYSRRAGTVADRMKDQVSEDKKSERSDILIDLDIRMRRDYMAGFVGGTEQVLFESEQVIGGRRYITGLTQRYMSVAVETDVAMPHDGICNVRITGILDDDHVLAEMTDE